MKTWLVIAAFVGMAWSVPAQAQNDITLLTGNTSGVHYPLGVALAKIWERTLPGAHVTVQPTQGSVENFNLLQRQRGTFAFGQGDVLVDAFQGNPEAGFAAPHDKLRVVASLFPTYLHLVALKSAKVASVHDLKGKRMAVGAQRSGDELSTRMLLDAAGMSYADLRRVHYVPYGEAISLMRRGQIDAVIVTAGLGVKAVDELMRAAPVDIVPIDGQTVAKTRGVMSPLAIPAKTYAGQPRDVPTAALSTFLVTHAAVPDALVYGAVKALFDNLPELQAAQVAAGEIDRRRALASRPIALHPGAERYFREVGLLR